MKNAFNEKGRLIGQFDGVFIRSNTDGSQLYRIDEEDVFSKLTYEGSNLAHMNKGQEIRIGKIKNGECIDDNGEIIFTIK